MSERRRTRRPAVNATVRALLRLGLLRRSTALLETTGRRTGRARVTPVTNGLIGDEFWIVTEHAGRAGYVRNLEADPHVRVRVGRRWRAGTAHVVEDVTPEDALRRLVEHNPATRRNAEVVRHVNSRMRVIRVDLDPVP